MRHCVQKPSSTPVPARFYCDAGLGGLARWLRAAGYEALWKQDIADDELLREARRTSTTVLTTDRAMMERRVLRDKIIPALWLNPASGIGEQLARVFHEFGLTLGESRCMACGGELRMADKDTLRQRIPADTYRWLNEFFLCSSCGKLFWHGTHWERIQKKLKAVLDRQSADRGGLSEGISSAEQEENNPH